MAKLIIADAGATKITWTLVTDGEVESITRTVGVNGLLADHNGTIANFSEAARCFGDPCEVEEVHYFGTGCSTPASCTKMENFIAEVWPKASIEVAGDMLLAARSLLGDSNGIACILGTGSNAVLCEGGEIKRSGAGLGFILGDNGAGTELGKRLLADYFKGRVPEDLAANLSEETGITLESALDNIYSRPAPNRYLASFARFLGEHRNHHYVAALLADEFCRFLLRDVVPLMTSADTRVCLTGSVAKAFEEELRTAAADLGLTEIGTITADPMEGIVRYYINKQTSKSKQT